MWAPVTTYAALPLDLYPRTAASFSSRKLVSTGNAPVLMSIKLVSASLSFFHFLES